MKLLISRLLPLIIAVLPVAGNEAEELSSISVYTAFGTVKPGDAVPVAVEISVADGWHTYAREPGDSGMPPSISITGYDGIEIAEWRFPPHKKFIDASGTTYGYEERVVLISEIQIPAALDVGELLQFEVAVDWMICRDICIWKQDMVNLDIRTGDETGVPVNEWWNLLEAGGWAGRTNMKSRAMMPAKEE